MLTYIQPRILLMSLVVLSIAQDCLEIKLDQLIRFFLEYFLGASDGLFFLREGNGCCS